MSSTVETIVELEDWTHHSTNCSQISIRTCSTHPDLVPQSQTGVSVVIQEGVVQGSTEATAGDAVTVYPKGAQFLFICSALVLVTTLGGLDGNIVATAVPAITNVCFHLTSSNSMSQLSSTPTNTLQYFHTVSDVGWYASAYRLCSCAFQFLFGRLYKIFAAKHVLLATIVVFMVGSVICAAATTSPMFVLGRAITGVGFAGINAGYLAIACQILPLRKRPVFNGVMAGIESISVISAPILGGILTDKLNWRWCFWINLPVGAIALLTIIFALPKQHVSAAAAVKIRSWKQLFRELDLIGTCVFIPCLTALFIALSWAGLRYSWSDPKIIGCFVAFVVLLGVFAADQYVSQEKAILPPRILRNKNVIAGFIFSACTNGTEAVLEYYMPTYFQTVRNYSASESGYLMLPIMIGFLIGLLIHGSGTSMVGYYTPFMLGASILMPIAVGLITTWQVSTGLVDILALCAFAGFSTSIGFQGPQSAVQTTLPDQDASTGLAVILFAQGFGPALFLAAAQTIFTSRLTANLHAFAPDVDVQAVESMGIGEIKAGFGARYQQEISMSFDKALTQTWYLSVASASLTMIGSFFTEWRSVKTKKL